MFGNLTSNEQLPTGFEAIYPILDNNLPFSDYQAQCRALIETRREDLTQPQLDPQRVILANTPFELIPQQNSSTNHYAIGALLVHGLLDSPFSMLDTAKHLQKQGIFCRSVLLPGHGTTPNDLMHVSYRDWINTTRYGVESMINQVDKLFLIGYSTGAMLSMYHVLKDPRIAGMVMIAPPFKLKAPVLMMVGWHQFAKRFMKNKEWIIRLPNVDYVKYRSIPFNPALQLFKLMEETTALQTKQTISCPIMIIQSHEDETVSSHAAMNFFFKSLNKQNRLLLYSIHHHHYHDNRVIVRNSRYSALNIEHFSHVAISFAMDNYHYGQQGDFQYASRLGIEDAVFGAYNRIEVETAESLYKLRLLKKRRLELTYNPDFDFTMNQLSEFIFNC